MRGLTDLGNAAVLIGLLLLIGLVWWWRRRTWRPLWLLAGAYLGAWALSDTVKDLTHRARPPAAQAIGHWTGYAFPSGHTTKATAVYGMLAALLAAATPHWGHKVALWTAAALLAGLVGLSRLYLGAHWLTDVLGALALGAAWLFILLTATRTVDALRAASSDDQPTPPDRRPPREPEIPAEDTGLVEPARRYGTTEETDNKPCLTSRSPSSQTGSPSTSPAGCSPWWRPPGCWPCRSWCCCGWPLAPSAVASHRP